MRTLYEDDIFPGTNPKYKGKTIGEILKAHPNPQRFIKGFNGKSNAFCLSDEISVDHRRSGQFGVTKYRTE